MILFYEVYEKGTGYDGPCFPTIEECHNYINGQVILSERTYLKGKDIEDFEILPHFYTGVEDLLRDEYGDEEYEYLLRLKYNLTLDK